MSHPYPVSAECFAGGLTSGPRRWSVSSFWRGRAVLRHYARSFLRSSSRVYAYTLQLLFEFASNQYKVSENFTLEQIVMGFLAHIEATRDNGARTRNARLAAITPRTGGDPPFGGTRFSKRGGRANDSTLARYVLGPL